MHFTTLTHMVICHSLEHLLPFLILGEEDCSKPTLLGTEPSVINGQWLAGVHFSCSVSGMFVGTQAKSIRASWMAVWWLCGFISSHHCFLIAYSGGWDKSGLWVPAISLATSLSLCSHMGLCQWVPLRTLQVCCLPEFHVLAFSILFWTKKKKERKN
jgi:hypothetical protein